jgi:hypothetical protein
MAGLAVGDPQPQQPGRQKKKPARVHSTVLRAREKLEGLKRRESRGEHGSTVEAERGAAEAELVPVAPGLKAAAATAAAATAVETTAPAAAAATESSGESPAGVDEDDEPVGEFRCAVLEVWGMDHSYIAKRHQDLMMRGLRAQQAASLRRRSAPG